MSELSQPEGVAAENYKIPEGMSCVTPLEKAQIQESTPPTAATGAPERLPVHRKEDIGLAAQFLQPGETTSLYGPEDSMVGADLLLLGPEQTIEEKTPPYGLFMLVMHSLGVVVKKPGTAESSAEPVVNVECGDQNRNLSFGDTVLISQNQEYKLHNLTTGGIHLMTTRAYNDKGSAHLQDEQTPSRPPHP